LVKLLHSSINAGLAVPAGSSILAGEEVGSPEEIVDVDAGAIQQRGIAVAANGPR
jgi:hypothetical protein